MPESIGICTSQHVISIGAPKQQDPLAGVHLERVRVDVGSPGISRVASRSTGDIDAITAWRSETKAPLKRIHNRLGRMLWVLDSQNGTAPVKTKPDSFVAEFRYFEVGVPIQIK